MCVTGRSGPVAANAPTTPSRRVAEALRGAAEDANPKAHQQLQPERQGRARACLIVAVRKNALERDRRRAREKTAHIERQLFGGTLKLIWRAWSEAAIETRRVMRGRTAR